MQIGITFDQCNVTSADDAHYHRTFLNAVDGVTKGCKVTADRQNIYVAKGYFVIYGRFVKVTGQETITPDAVQTGTLYCRLVYEVDLSKIDEKYLDTEKTKLQLTVGDEVTLSFTILPEEMASTEVELTAADATILSIDGLKVKALKEGETKVTAKAGEKTAECTVTVKAAAKTLAEATLEDIGKIAGKDGIIYATKADAEAVATGNAVAMIAYVGTASDCAHGLAIALADESGTKNYGAAGTACSGKAAVTGGTWRLPSIKDWQYMFIGCGASGSYSDNPSSMSYSGLASKLTTAQGDALQPGYYWSSTEYFPGTDAWDVSFDGSSNASFGPENESIDSPRVRACLAF